MRYPLFLFACALLLGCDSPSPAFMGGEVSRHEVGGHQFSVYVQGEQAQAIRTNFAKKPDIRSISQQAELAMETARGCPVSKIHGDVAVLIGTYDCSRAIVAGEWAKWAPPPRQSVLCEGYGSRLDPGGRADIFLECY